LSFGEGSSGQGSFAEGSASESRTGSPDIGNPARGPDFDDDGFHDLAVGMPGSSVPGTGEGAGAVVVVMGSATGLTADRSQLWHQDSDDLLGAAKRHDGFGSSVIGRDVDGDTIDDVAVGVCGEDDPQGAGAVQVLYGSLTGLGSVGNQLIRQPGSVPRRHEKFGYALGAGHLDEVDVLFELIASAHDDVHGEEGAGAVTVMYGTPDGVSLELVERWTQRTAGVLGKAEPNDAYGRSLAVADVDNDDNSELAIGVQESFEGAAAAGAVAVLYGTFTGLGTDRDQLWSQDSPDVVDEAEPQDGFGNDVVLGDFDNDGFNDLGVAVAEEGFDGLDRAGAVHIVYGTAAGLDPARGQLWTRPDLGGIAATDDRFGAAITLATSTATRSSTWSSAFPAHRSRADRWRCCMGRPPVSARTRTRLSTRLPSGGRVSARPATASVRR